MTSRSQAAQRPSATQHFDADQLLIILRELAVPPCAITRTTVLPFDHGRQENDAEHSFSLALVAMCIAPLIDEKLDLGLISQYALVHDLVEIYAGDTSVYADQRLKDTKHRRERAAYDKLRGKFGDAYPWLLKTLDDYASRVNSESKFVYALDKIMPHAMVILGEYHPVKPPWERYQETERAAKLKIQSAYPALSPIFDEICHRYALRPYLFSTPPDPGTVSRARNSTSEHRG